MLKSFKEFLKENINKNNIENLKKFMEKQPGYISWDINDDILTIKFKSNKQAITAMKKSHDSFLDITAFGETSTENSEITVELNNNTLKALKS